MSMEPNAALEKRASFGLRSEMVCDSPEMAPEKRASHGLRSEMVCESPEMNAILDELCRPDLAALPVLITGESGVGKELVARAVHAASPRAGGPFIPVNCAALPNGLVESELFGHRHGAFTGARSDKRGVFVEADGGTLFLDEIGELPLDVQPKLLRTLETMRVRPVGSAREEAVDVRLVAATNRNLAEMADNGLFRRDLLYRIDVVFAEIPPLRKRRQDLRALVPHLLRRYGAEREISPAAMQVLETYDWPGNVRELRNVLLRAVSRTGSSISEADVLCALRRDASSLRSTGLRQDAFRYASETLAANHGHRRATYEQLGIGRSTFYRWLRSGRVRDEGTWRERRGYQLRAGGAVLADVPGPATDVLCEVACAS